MRHSVERYVDVNDIFRSFDDVANKMFKDMFPQTSKELGLQTIGSYHKCDVIEYDDSHHVIAEIPGLSKDDLSIKFSEGALVISGNKKSEDTEPKNGGRYIYKELKRSTFKRVFYLDETRLDVKRIEAKFNNGVVNINIPKIKPEEKNEIEIVIK
jgi:HSP20 family protein